MIFEKLAKKATKPQSCGPPVKTPETPLVRVGDPPAHRATLGVARLVLDTRQERDWHDKQTIRAVLDKDAKETFIYEHVPSSQEQLLWIVDVVEWCCGAGGESRRRVTPLVARVVDLDTWSG